MTPRDIWKTIYGYARRTLNGIRRLIFAGPSRDDEFWQLSLFHLSLRRWRTKSTRWDIILWWPRVIVIKGALERPTENDETAKEDTT